MTGPNQSPESMPSLVQADHMNEARKSVRASLIALAVLDLADYAAFSNPS